MIIYFIVEGKYLKKDEIYMTYLLLSPTKGMSGLVDNNESLLDISNNIDSNYLMSVIVLKKDNKLKVLGTDEDFNIVYNNESPIKFIKKGLSLVYSSENVGIRLDNTDKGSEIIYNYLKCGSEQIVRSIDEFYINGIVYHHRNERIKQRELRKSMKL